MADFVDYYRALDLAHTATQAEIRDQYRFLVTFYHPDKHPDSKKAYAERRTAEMNAAYHVIGDPTGRAEYDLLYQHHVSAGDGKHDPAEIAYEAARELVSLIQGSGFTEQFAGKVVDYRDRAVRQLKSIIARWPSSAWALTAQFDIMMLYANVARSLPLALEAARELGRRAPKGEYRDWAAFVIAGVYAEQGQHQKAEELFQALSETSLVPDLQTDGAFAIGEMYRNLARDYRKAVVSYERFLQQFPDHEYCAAARYHVARMLDSDLLRYAEAVRVYEDIVRLHPGTSEASDSGWRIDYIRRVHLGGDSGTGANLLRQWHDATRVRTAFDMVDVTDETFEREVLSSDKPVLAVFWAPGCAPYAALVPILEKLAAEMSDWAKFVKVNASEQRSTAGRYQIQAVPTLLIFRGGDVAESIVGYQSEQELRYRMVAAASIR